MIEELYNNDAYLCNLCYILYQQSKSRTVSLVSDEYENITWAYCNIEMLYQDLWFDYDLAT